MRDSPGQGKKERSKGSSRVAPLVTLTEFASTTEIIDFFSEQVKTPEGRQRLRWQLAWAQRREIFKAGLGDEFKSLVKCHAVPVPAFSKKKDGTYSKTGSPGCVEAHYYGGDGDRPIGYAWVYKDANALLCFVCAPKIRYYRAAEVQFACKAMIDLGYSWCFWTFTAPHNLFTDPDTQVKKFNEAKRLLKSGRWWKDFKKRWGYEHCIDAVEMTDDHPRSIKKSGCHWHSHDLPFFLRDPLTADEAAAMQAEVATRWVDCLLKVGLCTEEKKADALAHAFRLDRPRKPKKTVELAAYLAKGASCELTPGIFTKIGRIPARITHWELMTLAFSGVYPELVPRALAVMRALKGKHWLHWTPGLRRLVGLEDVSDQEIMEERKSLPVYQFKGDSWRKVDSQKWQVNLLNAAIRDLKKKGFDLSLSPEELDEDKIKVIHTVFADNMRKVGLGVDPEKMEFYSFKIVDRNPVSVHQYLADLIDQNLQRFGRQLASLRC